MLLQAQRSTLEVDGYGHACALGTQTSPQARVPVGQQYPFEHAVPPPHAAPQAPQFA